jgi:Rad3-related DNA helicase
MNDFVYKPTTALDKISDLINENDLSIIQGGQGAGKTIAILMLMIDLSWRKKIEITICSSELSKLKDTAVNDFIKILKDWGIFKLKDWNKSENIYRFDSGGFIEFIGLDKADVGKGRRRDYVFINETNKVSLQSFTDITARAKKVICDFNPDEYFYLHDLKTESNFISLTFNDNEF